MQRFILPAAIGVATTQAALVETAPHRIRKHEADPLEGAAAAADTSTVKTGTLGNAKYAADERSDNFQEKFIQDSIHKDSGRDRWDKAAHWDSSGYGWDNSTFMQSMNLLYEFKPNEIVMLNTLKPHTYLADNRKADDTTLVGNIREAFHGYKGKLSEGCSYDKSCNFDSGKGQACKVDFELIENVHLKTFFLKLTEVPTNPDTNKTMRESDAAITDKDEIKEIITQIESAKGFVFATSADPFSMTHDQEHGASYWLQQPSLSQKNFDMNKGGITSVQILGPTDSEDTFLQVTLYIDHLYICQVNLYPAAMIGFENSDAMHAQFISVSLTLHEQRLTFNAVERELMIVTNEVIAADLIFKQAEAAYHQAVYDAQAMSAINDLWSLAVRFETALVRQAFIETNIAPGLLNFDYNNIEYVKAVNASGKMNMHTFYNETVGNSPTDTYGWQVEENPYVASPQRVHFAKQAPAVLRKVREGREKMYSPNGREILDWQTIADTFGDKVTEEDLKRHIYLGNSLQHAASLHAVRIGYVQYVFDLMNTTVEHYKEICEAVDTSHIFQHVIHSGEVHPELGYLCAFSKELNENFQAMSKNFEDNGENGIDYASENAAVQAVIAMSAHLSEIAMQSIRCEGKTANDTEAEPIGEIVKIMGQDDEKQMSICEYINETPERKRTYKSNQQLMQLVYKHLLIKTREYHLNYFATKADAVAIQCKHDEILVQKLNVETQLNDAMTRLQGLNDLVRRSFSDFHRRGDRKIWPVEEIADVISRYPHDQLHMIVYELTDPGIHCPNESELVKIEVYLDDVLWGYVPSVCTHVAFAVDGEIAHAVESTNAVVKVMLIELGRQSPSLRASFLQSGRDSPPSHAIMVKDAFEGKMALERKPGFYDEYVTVMDFFYGIPPATTKEQMEFVKLIRAESGVLRDLCFGDDALCTIFGDHGAQCGDGTCLCTEGEYGGPYCKVRASTST